MREARLAAARVTAASREKTGREEVPAAPPLWAWGGPGAAGHGTPGLGPYCPRGPGGTREMGPGSRCPLEEAGRGRQWVAAWEDAWSKHTKWAMCLLHRRGCVIKL